MKAELRKKVDGYLLIVNNRGTEYSTYLCDEQLLKMTGGEKE